MLTTVAPMLAPRALVDLQAQVHRPWGVLELLQASWDADVWEQARAELRRNPAAWQGGTLADLLEVARAKARAGRPVDVSPRRPVTLAEILNAGDATG